MENKAEKDRCESEIQELKNFREDIPAAVEKLVATCNKRTVLIMWTRNRFLAGCDGGHYPPSAQDPIPGYFIPEQLDKVKP